MADYQDAFKRYEKKYMLTTPQYKTLLAHLDDYIEKDHYGLHTIGNIYFDTDNYELIRRSIEKPVYKEKLRLRNYGAAKKADSVFIELKKKYKGVVYKRRIKTSLQEAQDYLIRGKPLAHPDQIINEINWFMQRYHPIPKVYIAYDREAFCGRNDNDLRITFDHRIRFRDTCFNLAHGDWGHPLLEPEQILMEIKIPGVMPIWLSQFLSVNNIFPTPFSKYGTCYQKYLVH